MYPNPDIFNVEQRRIILLLRNNCTERESARHVKQHARSRVINRLYQQ